MLREEPSGGKGRPIEERAGQQGDRMSSLFAWEGALLVPGSEEGFKRQEDYVEERVGLAGDSV